MGGGCCLKFWSPGAVTETLRGKRGSCKRYRPARNSEVQHVKKTGKLPVVNFAAGGVATPADAALCMQLGVDGVFVGSGTLVACWTFCPCQRSLSCNARKAETPELSALLSRSGA